MITIFTSAKPFIGKIKISQYNAIRSWKALQVEKEIILFGKGEGYSQAVHDLNLTWIPEVETSPQGTPTVNSMFKIVKERGKYPIRTYVNCDIILLPDFSDTLRNIRFKVCLIVSQRYDLDLNRPIDFNKFDYENELHRMIENHSEIHPPAGSDIFVFTGWPWDGIPELVIGRAGYDNELIFHCRKNNIPVIDASRTMTLIHQNHNYGHHPSGLRGVRTGEEAIQNKRFARGRSINFTICEANYLLTKNGIRQKKNDTPILRRMKVMKELNKGKVKALAAECVITLILYFQKMATLFRCGKQV
ncbi:MAG: hypothetical protein K8S14_08055 [Actinomycetia bacterium]|nr:hypothetical protein [Actinomycetes bacterium]